MRRNEKEIILNKEKVDGEGMQNGVKGEEKKDDKKKCGGCRRSRT